MIIIVPYAVAKVLRNFQHEISATEEYEPEPPIESRGVKSHIEAKTRPIESGCTIGLLRSDHDMVQAAYIPAVVDGPAATSFSQRIPQRH